MRPDACVRVAARALSTRASAGAPSTSSPRAGPVTIALRAFVAGCTLYACDAALDDYVLLGVAKSLARERSTIDDDARLREALGDDYADDGAWWKSTVSRGGRSDVARVVWTIEGAKAACDVTLTMLNRRAERESGLGWTRFAPPSLAHAALGTSMWTAFAVDCSLPTTRGGWRSALVSLMRDVDAAADGASAAKVEKKS
jgi:hypothetical protein